ncbi:hypothetical protein, partial [Halomonas sp. PR-M31]|uniref:hypothetical protein n=1 Tax=Halomonas sp. PR-M31 TaxID=1471202 RepID=UPI00065204D3
WFNAVSLMDGLSPMRIGNENNNRVFDYNQDGTVDSGDDVGGEIVLSVKAGGMLTAPKFNQNTQYAGVGAQQDNAGSVQKILMNFGIRPWTGRSAWYQLR